MVLNPGVAFKNEAKKAAGRVRDFSTFFIRLLVRSGESKLQHSWKRRMRWYVAHELTKPYMH